MNIIPLTYQTNSLVFSIVRNIWWSSRTGDNIGDQEQRRQSTGGRPPPRRQIRILYFSKSDNQTFKSKVFLEKK